MGAMQRRKGYLGEAEIVRLLRASGKSAYRIAQLEAGGEMKGDVRVDGYVASVKYGQHVPKFLYDALGEAKLLFCRRNHQPWLVVMRLKDWA